MALSLGRGGRDNTGRPPVHFWDNVDASGDCWLWLAGKTRDGYGRVRYQGHDRMAHHVAWLLLVGPIPTGLVPDHLCRIRACVNVGAHVEWVTAAENTWRGHLPGRLGPKARDRLGRFA